MKIEYEELKMEVIAFEAEDIIRASGALDEPSEEDAIKPPVNTFDF